MASISLATWGLIGLALIFGFYNGLRDSSNIVATIVYTQAMRAKTALLMASLGIGIGPFLFGNAVAKTIGRDVVDESAITVIGIYAAVLAALAWTTFTLYAGVPSSSSHTLLGGFIGAAWAGYGLDTVIFAGVLKMIASLLLSPLLGLLAGYYVVRLVYAAGRGLGMTPKANRWLRHGQIIAGMWSALAQGSNDAQKTMGIIVMALVADGNLETFSMPLWVVAISGAAMALGTALGDWKLIQTLGRRFYRLRPVHGFSAQLASTMVILGAGLLGGPVSTTHVVSSAIVGAGSAERVQMIRWKVIDTILLSWLVTIPATIILGAIFYLAIDAFF